jgi:hypothetical protein
MGRTYSSRASFWRFSYWVSSRNSRWELKIFEVFSRSGVGRPRDFLMAFWVGEPGASLAWSRWVREGDGITFVGPELAELQKAGVFVPKLWLVWDEKLL